MMAMNCFKTYYSKPHLIVPHTSQSSFRVRTRPLQVLIIYVELAPDEVGLGRSKISVSSDSKISQGDNKRTRILSLLQQKLKTTPST